MTAAVPIALARPHFTLALLLAAHAVLAVASLRRNSVTVDEVAHLPAGVSYWQQGTFTLYHHNPPLVKLLAALPVLASRPTIHYGGSWADAQRRHYPPSQAAFAAEFMRTNAGRYFELYFRARYVIVAISLVGAIVVFAWAKDLFGPAAGLTAAALWTFSPNILAHAGLVTTDVAATVAGLAGTYAFWRWLRRPTLRCALLAGTLLGIAQLVKFSSLLLYAIWPLAALLCFLAQRGFRFRISDFGFRISRPTPFLKQVGHALLILLASLLVINAGYAFEGTFTPLGGFPFVSALLTRPRTAGQSPYPGHPDSIMRVLYAMRQNRFQDTWLQRLPVPLPRHYMLGYDEQSFETRPSFTQAERAELAKQDPPVVNVSDGYPVYLRGALRTHKDPRTGRVGWWHYYLYALAVKVPLGTWALLAAALVAALASSRARAPAGDEIMLWLPPLIILAALSFLTDINLGLRYVLPVLPYLWISASRLAPLCCPPPSALHAPLSTLHPLSRALAPAILGITLGWNVMTGIAAYPHYLSYFNQLAGGPQNGHRHLIDSNLDWGQDLLELQRWLEAHPQRNPTGLAYFGLVDPALAGISFRLPPLHPAPRDRQHPGGAGTLREGSRTQRSQGEPDPKALAPGLYAISVNYLMGLPFRTYDEHGRLVQIPRDAYRYFQRLQPLDRAGYSIWIYRID